MTDPLFSVAGKRVMITGGSSGIGLQLVKLFASRGAAVASVATAHDSEICAAVAAVADGVPVAFIRSNLRDEAGVTSAFDEAVAILGTPDILFNNAGISQRKRFLEATRDDWNSLMEINLKAMFFVAQEGAKRMIDAGMPGSIINMTSILSAKAMTGTSVYSTAKAGITQMTKAMAFELAGQGIRVNAIAPGWFETRMTSEFLNSGAKSFLKSVNPMRRLGEPGDIDGAALLLGSEAGRYITGTVITVDGGQSLSG